MIDKQDNKAVLGIHFGALADPLAKQLKSQGFLFDKKKVTHFEKLKECMTHLRFADILNDSDFRKAETKLYNKIKRHICQKNKLKAR